MLVAAAVGVAAVEVGVGGAVRSGVYHLYRYRSIYPYKSGGVFFCAKLPVVLYCQDCLLVLFDFSVRVCPVVLIRPRDWAPPGGGFREAVAIVFGVVFLVLRFHSGLLGQQ